MSAGRDRVVKRIDVMQPWLGDEELAAVNDVMHSGWVAQGPRVEEFEDQFAERQEVGHAVATSSCTAALHLAMVVSGVAPGDDVVVPSYCSAATANAPSYVGARAIFADVDPATGNITATHVEAALTHRTTAVIAVDQGGMPVDLEPIRGLCEPLAIRVIEDATCGAGAEYHGRPVGAGADLTVWSFQSHQILTTGEGGMLTTNNPAWALRARRIRERATTPSAATRGSVLAIAEVGFDYRMTDLQAAVGVVQLGRLDEIVRRRRDLAARYSVAIATIPGLRPVTDPDHGASNYQSYWVEVLDYYPLDRDGLLAALARAGISAERGITAAHLDPNYDGHTGLVVPLPVTESLTCRTLVLPLFHQMSGADQARVIDVLRSAGSGTRTNHCR